MGSDTHEQKLKVFPTNSHETMRSSSVDYMRGMQNPQGYVCLGCGAWVLYNSTHNCPGYMKAQTQVSVWPTVEWLTLQELKRIANALEKIAGIQSPEAGQPGASQCQNESQSSAKVSPPCSQS